MLNNVICFETQSTKKLGPKFQVGVGGGSPRACSKFNGTMTTLTVSKKRKKKKK